jgi:hypothetical protein
MAKVLVMCATRSRPEKLKRMIGSIRRTSEADIAIYADEDDDFPYETVPGDLTRGPRIGPCRAANKLADLHPGYDLYGWGVDDCEFVTPGWDKWALEAATKFSSGIGAVSPKTVGGADGRMDFPFLTGAWVSRWGSFVPYEVEHFYWDIALQIVAEEVGIIFAEESEFAIEHEGIMPVQVEPKPETVSDYGRRVLNQHVDARTTCRWLALERKKMVEALTS